MENQSEQSHAIVLYIEGDPMVQQVIGGALESLSCHVIQAYSFRTAKASIEREDPINLVLLGDIYDPKVPAAEMRLLEMLRSTPAYRKVPIIIATDIDWRPAAYQAGATAYLEKPFDVGQLQTAITPYLPIGL